MLAFNIKREDAALNHYAALKVFFIVGWVHLKKKISFQAKYEFFKKFNS